MLSKSLERGLALALQFSTGILEWGNNESNFLQWYVYYKGHSLRDVITAFYDHARRNAIWTGGIGIVLEYQSISNFGFG